MCENGNNNKKNTNEKELHKLLNWNLTDFPIFKIFGKFWKILKNFQKKFQINFFQQNQKRVIFSIISDIKHLKYMFWLKISNLSFQNLKNTLDRPNYRVKMMYYDRQINIGYMSKKSNLPLFWLVASY